MSGIVIIGGGLAGAKTAEGLRHKGYDGEVVLIAAETDLPYERPPLSKSFLAGQDPFDKAVVHPEDWYRDQSVDLRLGARATALNLADHVVEIDSADSVPYDKLVLAIGAVPRRLPGLDPDVAGLHYLRTRGDSEALRSEFGEGRRLAVVGAGWIGLEAAAVARQAGTDVVVVDTAPAPLLAALGPEMGAMFADLHRDHGVDLRLGVDSGDVVVDGGRARGLRFADGTTIDADAVLVGIGVRPDVALAERAGLAIDNGVLVDASLKTSHDDVYAVGDVANHAHPLLGRRIRVEHWANALKQPATAVAALLGEDARYQDLPYFYSDQYDLGMEYVGDAAPGEDLRVVTRGDVAGRTFIAFWLDRSDRPRAGMAVNTWDVIDDVKRLILAGRAVPVDRLTDPSVELSSIS